MTNNRDVVRAYMVGGLVGVIVTTLLLWFKAPSMCWEFRW